MTPARFLDGQLVRPARDWLARDQPALAVDVFRVLVALLAGSWFVRLMVEFPAVSDPAGLIDHAVTQDIHPFTRLGLFQPGTPAWVLILAYAVGLAATGAILLGIRTRAAAAVALVVAASAYRWNFVVMYLDDAVVHLMLFWLILLPAGRTLTWAGWRAGPAARAAWIGERVPGPAVRCLLVNVCWIYFLAGVWKLDSPLWRDGLGLYASLKVEVARMPDVWRPEHLPFLRIADWVVLAVEPVLPLAMLAPPRRALRWLGAIAFTVFNGFILATLGITWAILGLTATLTLFLGEEVARGMRRLLRADAAPAPTADRALPRRWGAPERLAVAFMAVLFLATARHVPVFGALNVPAHAVLWSVGVAQDYRLFNWIDRVAYHVDTTIDVRGPDGLERPVPDGAWPTSFRARLLQGYAHDVRWLFLPEGERFPLRIAILRRHVAWFCRYVEEPGTEVEIVSIIRPIRPEPPPVSATRAMRFARFRCEEPGSVDPVEGGVPVPPGRGWLQARLIDGLTPLETLQPRALASPLRSLSKTSSAQ